MENIVFGPNVWMGCGSLVLRIVEIFIVSQNCIWSCGQPWVPSVLALALVVCPVQV